VEYLRTDSTQNQTDQVLSLWLEDQYIRAFTKINRLDGLVVRDYWEMNTILYAHESYTRIFPMPVGTRLPSQRIWVPGLEPICEPSERDMVKFDRKLAPRGGFENYEMYKSYETRTGTCLGRYRDTMGWEREIWEAPKLPQISRPVVKVAATIRTSVPEGQIEQKPMLEGENVMHSPDKPVGLKRKMVDRSRLTGSQMTLLERFANVTESKQSAPFGGPYQSQEQNTETEFSETSQSQGIDSLKVERYQEDTWQGGQGRYTSEASTIIQGQYLSGRDAFDNNAPFEDENYNPQSWLAADGSELETESWSSSFASNPPLGNTTPLQTPSNLQASIDREYNSNEEGSDELKGWSTESEREGPDSDRD